MPDSFNGRFRRVIPTRVRQTMLVLVSVASMAGAGAALWAWLSPETIQATTTISLFALVALLFLPVATLAALEADRRRSHERRTLVAACAPISAAPVTPARAAAPVVSVAPAPPAPASAPPPYPPARVLHHTPLAHDRPTTSRRRRARPAPECSPAALPR